MSHVHRYRDKCRRQRPSFDSIDIASAIFYSPPPSKQETLGLSTILDLTVVGPPALGIASVATSSSGSVGADGGSATESGTTGAQNNNTDAGTAVVGIQENPPFRLLTSVPQAWPLPAGQALH